MPYVKEGLVRFVTEQYAEGLPVGCIIGYAIDGDLPFALQQVHAAITAKAAALRSRGGIINGDVATPVKRFRTDHDRDVSAQIEVRHFLLPFAAMAGPSGASAP
jgi:hypothetical protein